MSIEKATLGDALNFLMVPLETLPFLEGLGIVAHLLPPEGSVQG